MAEPKFLTGNLMRHVAVMAFTGSIGLMALFVVDFVDLIFISMLGQAELAAAVGYAGAILFFTTSVGIGLSIAMAALVARSLGAREPERARRYATNVLATGFILACSLAVITWLLVPSILALLGAAGRTHSLATDYLRIIVPSMPVLVIGMGGVAILRAHGDANRAMWATLMGGIVNAILDPIFIFALEFELNGAAMASVMARFAVLITAYRSVFRHYSGLAPFDLRAMREDVPAIWGVAIPAVLTNIATPIGNAYVTGAMAPFGDAAIAGMAIVGRLTPVAFGVVFALSGAIGPIVGQNFGAQEWGRVRQTVIEGLRFVVAFVVVVAGVLFVLRGVLADLFDAQGETLDLIYLFCGPLALVFAFNGALFASNATFNNLNRPFYSTWLNWGRNTLGTVPLVTAGAMLGGAQGVLIGQAIGGVVFGVLSVWLSFRLIKAYTDGRIVPGQSRPTFRWPFPLNPFTTHRG